MSAINNHRRLIVWIAFPLALICVMVCILYQAHTRIAKIDQPTYLWSKRVFDINDYNLLETEKISSPNIISDQIKVSNKVIWIRNTSSNSHIISDLDHLSKLLHLIDEPVILVTSDGDRSVPSSYSSDSVARILSSPKIKKWYTQNYDKSLVHSKFGYYPIGLDMHTPLWLKSKTFEMSDLIQSNAELRAQKFNHYLAARDQYQSAKKNKIFCDAHLSLTHPRRKEMFEILKNNALIEFQDLRIHWQDIIEKYAQHRFVLSPRGNGLDCHRTWEALLAGAIVITESSSLDDMFVNNDLPVIILKNFEELNAITEEQLEKWYNENNHKTDKSLIIQKFRPEYWIKEK